MTKRKEGYRFPKEAINEEIKLIDGSNTDYVSKTCRVYKCVGLNEFIEKKTRIHSNGYVYCSITYDGKNKQTRMHRAVAKAFIDNPNNYDVVGHKDNNKSNNNVNNLYWTTTSENTQKAYDDKLAKNHKGFEDSQSKAVDVFKNGEFLETIGSITLCAEKFGVSKSTIIRKCNNVAKTSARTLKEYSFKFHENL